MALDRVKAAIAEKFSPAVDFKAPYAKVMLDEAARAAIETIRDVTDDQRDALSALGLMWRDLNSEIVWHAYVDALLGGTPPAREGRDPLTQFQIGDGVVYTPEGIITRVIGYLWSSAIGSAPKVVGYELACGVTVPAHMLQMRPGNFR